MNLRALKVVQVMEETEVRDKETNCQVPTQFSQVIGQKYNLFVCLS